MGSHRGRAVLPSTWSVPVGVAALALAAAGEWAARGATMAVAAIPLYLGAIILWALSAPVASLHFKATGDLRWRGTRRLAAGAGIAALLAAVAVAVLRRDEHSSVAAWPWLAALVALVATAVLAGRDDGWQQRWPDARPKGRGWRWTWVAVGLILVAAAVARLVRLDRVPLGINADEGDRAALSLQIVNGVETPGIFEGGWYRISMVYFWTLAQAMRVVGTSYADARVLGAVAGTMTVGVITWIGVKHFGIRVGLLAGGLLAVLGVALQFSRETTEAAPTAMLWTISMAFMLEAVRTGRAAAWIGAGMAGGAGLYFYPSGRSWLLFAVAFFAYLGVRGIGVPRRLLALRMGLCLLAAAVVMAPFLSYGLRHPDVLYKRATETTVLDRANAARLGYYDPDWSTVRLLAEQSVRAIGIFDHFRDEGGFWPIDRPVLPPAAAVLVLLGVGWTCLRWRDPRAVLLALWFLVGLSGVVLTVETPNLHRLAIAVPALTLFAALVLDDLRLRIVRAIERRAAHRVFDLALVGLVALIGWSEAGYYFADYARSERWIRPNAEGQAVAEQGAGALVVTLGRNFHMVNSGWVRLLAQKPARGGIEAPGSDLPLTVPPERALAFMLDRNQLAYVPYLEALYPGGRLKEYANPTEGLILVIYRLSQERWEDLQGAQVRPSGGSPARVGTFGEAPAGWARYPARMEWSAGLRVARYGNYALRILRGPATLTIDGVEVIRASSAAPSGLARISLASGMHSVRLEAVATEPGQALLEWTGVPVVEGTAPTLRPVLSYELNPVQVRPEGLLGRIDVKGRPQQRRLDGTLAMCCLGIREAAGASRLARWDGYLIPPVAGTYSLSAFSQGRLTIRIGRQVVLRSTSDADSVVQTRIRLTRRPHRVHIRYRVPGGPGGLELSWTPPGRRQSIIPPSALRPLPSAGIGKPLRVPPPLEAPYAPLITVP